MEVNTKYNVGDKVYIIAVYNLLMRTTKVVTPRMQIRRIDVKFAASDNPVIMYQFDGISALEPDVFVDANEALKTIDHQEEI